MIYDENIYLQKVLCDNNEHYRKIFTLYSFEYC